MAHVVRTVSASAEAQNWPARALAGKPEGSLRNIPETALGFVWWQSVKGSP